VECSDAILSHLEKERQRADVQQDDPESIQLYTHTIVRFAMDSASRSTHPHLKRDLVDLLIPRIDVLIAPMSLCLRAIDVELRDTGDFDADEILRIHITRYCAHLMISMSYDPKLLHAIQASLVASDFFALTWTWIDPRTQLPLFLGEERPGGGARHLGSRWREWAGNVTPVRAALAASRIVTTSVWFCLE
jgi:hypothetical protein